MLFLPLQIALESVYGDSLFIQIKTRSGQRLLREIFESGPDGILRSHLLKGANSSRRAGLASLISDGWVQMRIEEVFALGIFF